MMCDKDHLYCLASPPQGCDEVVGKKINFNVPQTPFTLPPLLCNILISLSILILFFDCFKLLFALRVVEMLVDFHFLRKFGRKLLAMAAKRQFMNIKRRR
jgi:hypothetical protein